MKTLLIIYIVNLASLSLAAFALYGKDKINAAAGKDLRIRESVLLGVATCGGAFCALLGRMIFRHKTQKLYFSIVIYTCCILQALVLAFLFSLKGGAL